MAHDKITLDNKEFRELMEAIVKALGKSQLQRVSQLRGYTPLEKHLMMQTITVEIQQAVTQVWAMKKFAYNGRARLNT